MKRISALLTLSLGIGLLGAGPALAAPAYINDVGSPCVTTTVGTTITLVAPCVTDHTLVVPNGDTLDGNGNSVTAMDPAGGHFVGAVIQAEAGTASVTVQNLTVDASGVVNEVCDAGLNELMGILYDGVGGTITNNNVQHIQQAVNSGCQEGHGIAVFNSTSTTKSVTITNNMVTDYQKTGILIDGNVSATIQNNTVSGKGQIDYIAQNGIQISGGASAKISGNSISNNYYGPAKVVACGILLYKAGGVSGASKNGLSYLKSDNTFANNEVDVCNFGKGGGFTPAS